MCVRLIFATVLLILAGQINAQVRVDTALLFPVETRWDDLSDTFRFPEIYADDINVARKINEYLKQDFLYAESEGSELLEAMIEYIADQTYYLDFKLTYHHDTILSIKIFSEACGAYCSIRQEYYNFNTRSGDVLSLATVLNMQSFRPILDRRIRLDFQEYQQSAARDLRNEMLELEDYNYMMEEVQQCLSNFNPEEFNLTEDSIEVIFPCYFPHVIRALEPGFNQSFRYADIAGMLLFSTN